MADKYLTTLALAAGTPSYYDAAPPAHLAVQADVDVYVLADESIAKGGAVSATNGVKVAAGQLYDVPLTSTEKRVGVVAVSGGGNCKLFARTKVLR